MLKILDVIEEQLAVKFTGKVNVLSTINRQHLGALVFKDGEIIQAYYSSMKGLKAFYQLVIDELSLKNHAYVVEPEVVEEKERQIHYPFSVLKAKLVETLKSYRESLKHRPPENVKILINADFLNDSLPVTSQEFQVLDVLTEWNNPADIYQRCDLLDHEITQTLVSLRKKDALKIVASRS